jgi:hypothetical protein
VLVVQALVSVAAINRPSIQYRGGLIADMTRLVVAEPIPSPVAFVTSAMNAERGLPVLFVFFGRHY